MKPIEQLSNPELVEELFKYLFPNAKIGFTDTEILIRYEKDGPWCHAPDILTSEDAFRDHVRGAMNEKGYLFEYAQTPLSEDWAVFIRYKETRNISHWEAVAKHKDPLLAACRAVCEAIRKEKGI